MKKFIQLLSAIVGGVGIAGLSVTMIFSVILLATYILPSLNVLGGYSVLYWIMVLGVGSFGVLASLVILSLSKRRSNKS